MTSPLDQLAAAASQLEESAQPEQAPAPEESQEDAGQQIAALQAQIEALRERQAVEDANKPYVLQVAPGSGKGAYQVPAGKSLPEIAYDLGLSNAYEQLFKPNMAAIEEAAHNAGYRGGSDQGSILIPDTWLIVPASSLATKPE